MKQYIIIKRAFRPGLFDVIEPTIYTEESLDVAIKMVNEFNYRNWMYKKEVVELTALIQDKSKYDMDDAERTKYNEEINALETELKDSLIDYDEWAAREFGDTKVDYYWTAINLHNAGYRKITKIKNNK